VKQSQGGNMGLLTSVKDALSVQKGPQARQQLDTHQAAQWLQVSAGTIFRDDENVVEMFCPAVRDLEPGYYACMLRIKKNQVAVVIGKPVTYLDERCLADAVEVFRAAQQTQIRGLLYVRGEGRKTASVYARI